MKVLILGSGGREHALGWAIKNADPDGEIVFCPGNGGTGSLGKNRPGSPADPGAMVEIAQEERPDLTLIGPEASLVAGVADQLRAAGFAVFGPSARAAAIEGSKVYSKTLMRDNGIPTAAFEIFRKPHHAKNHVRDGLFPKVVKADGLAAGKGAIVVRTPDEGEAAVAELMESGRFGAAGEKVLIESFIEGEEVSAFAIARDESYTLLPLAQDHKQIGEGDTGPNTGGMGAYAPFTRTTPELLRRIGEEVIGPTLRAMAEDGRPFRGLLYAGLMLSNNSPVVLEFNCRFGDPETQALVPLLGDGFLECLLSSARGEGPLPEILPARPPEGDPEYDPGQGAGSSVAVVLASAGYPGNYRTGFPIEGIEQAGEHPSTWVFHAGTEQRDRSLVTTGGRVLAVSARASDLPGAIRRAYEGASSIEFEGKTYRRDIGKKG